MWCTHSDADVQVAALWGFWQRLWRRLTSQKCKLWLEYPVLFILINTFLLNSIIVKWNHLSIYRDLLEAQSTTLGPNDFKNVSPVMYSAHIHTPTVHTKPRIMHRSDIVDRWTQVSFNHETRHHLCNLSSIVLSEKALFYSLIDLVWQTSIW